ncbi:hypothetical protein C8R43DRAFT_205025 [Mycena crocata]|nr:hypothetical protein C8R43DRAFT_205025 [Mycena crocata]
MLSFEIERAIFNLALNVHPEMRTTLRLVCRRAARWVSILSRDLPCSSLDGNTLSVAPQPCLPPELEHLIFTLVARKHPEMHSTLNLVCCRVTKWIEPFKMQCLFLATQLTPEHPLVCNRCHWKRFSTSELTTFFESQRRIAKGVRGLVLGWGIHNDPSPVYPLLPSLEYVVYGMRHRTVIRIPGFSLNTIFSLPIRRLAFNLAGLETLQHFAAAWARQPVSLSSTLTHLELPSFSTLGIYIEALSVLSHLSIDLNQHRGIKLFTAILKSQRRLLRRLLARESFLLLVLRILPYNTFTELVQPPSKYKTLLERCSIPTQKVVDLETSIDAPLGLCHYYSDGSDMWCEAEAAMKE